MPRLSVDLPPKLRAELSAVTRAHTRRVGGSTDSDADTVRRLIHAAYLALPPTTPLDPESTPTKPYCYLMGHDALAALATLHTRHTARTGEQVSDVELLRRLVHAARTLPRKPAPTGNTPLRTQPAAVYRFTASTRAALSKLAARHTASTGKRVTTTEALRRLVHAALARPDT